MFEIPPSGSQPSTAFNLACHQTDGKLMQCAQDPSVLV